MDFRSRLVGKDWHQSIAILAVAGVVAIALRVLGTVYPTVHLWPPEPLRGVTYIGFVKWAFLLGTAALLSYREYGVLTSLGIVYFGIVALPLGPTPYPDTLIQQFLSELWRPFYFCLIWGTLSYVTGYVARYSTTVVRQHNRASRLS